MSKKALLDSFVQFVLSSGRCELAHRSRPEDVRRGARDHRRRPGRPGPADPGSCCASGAASGEQPGSRAGARADQQHGARRAPPTPRLPQAVRDPDEALPGEGVARGHGASARSADRQHRAAPHGRRLGLGRDDLFLLQRRHGVERAQEAADKAEAERVEAERISKWRPLVATMDRCCKCLLGSRVSVVNLFLTRRLVHRDRSGGTCQGGCCCRCKRDRHCEGQGGGGTHPAGGG
jgi:hypothetical protein